MSMMDLRYNITKEAKDVKKWLLLIGLVIVLVACNNENSVNEENDVNVNNNDNGSLNEDNNNNDEEVIENNTEDNEEETNNDGVENNGENDNNTSEAGSTEDILAEKVYKILEAQREYDYDYLTSVLSEGSELDQENNTFTFNNVAYPHDQEFLDEVVEDDLEFRYTHEEEDGIIIVGFAAIDYENESSFVIDFEFVLDGNEWMMNDMDVNK